MSVEQKRFSMHYAYPAGEEPGWSSMVERWYQLDGAAFGTAELFWRHREELNSCRPDLILLASPGASNLTDFQFAAIQPPSPAKFVHTLANIRITPMLKLMEWTGRVFCIQDALESRTTAIREAEDLFQYKRDLHRIWVVSVTENTGFDAEILVLSALSRRNF
jgi:hypothetical protein